MIERKGIFMKEILFVLLPEFADWEAAPLAAAIQQNAAFCVKTAAPTREPVRSIGGFSVVPDYELCEAEHIDFAGLVLIGGKSWREADAETVKPLIRLAVERQLPIGAICDATVFLGAMGVLNEISHTSNLLEDLKNYAGTSYTGDARYICRQAVRDGLVVTANGTANLEFAKELLPLLGAMSETEAEQWYRFYKLGYYEAIKG